MKLLCWLFRHRLTIIGRNRTYGLDKVRCSRCKGVFAMHHPTQYFGDWDYESQEILDGRY